LSASPPKFRFALPPQVVFGRVTMSICARPASWLSAAKLFCLKRIDWIWSRFGRRPPLKPFMKNVAPPGPAIAESASARSSGSSGSASISSCVSVVVDKVFDPSGALVSLTTTSCLNPSISSVTVSFIAPRRSVSGAANGMNPGNSTCTVTGPGTSGDVATPCSSDMKITGSPL
jgi:hypothetical protein